MGKLITSLTSEEAQRLSAEDISTLYEIERKISGSGNPEKEATRAYILQSIEKSEREDKYKNEITFAR